MPWPLNIRKTHQTPGVGTTFKGRLLSLPTLVSFVVAGAFLLFLVTRFDIDLGSTWRSFKESNLFFFILALFIHYTSFLFRGARWRLVLQNAQENSSRPVPGILHCSQLILLGGFTNSVTWFRLGDAYRAYAYSHDTEGSFSHTIGTILAERALDTVLVLVLLASATLYLATSGVDTPWIFVGLAALMAVVLAAVVLVMWLFRSRLSRFLPGALQGAWQRFHEGTLNSFRRQLPLITILGLLGWLAEVGRLFLVTEALGLSIGVPLIIFVTLANAMLTLVPITPGGLGAVEWGTTSILMLSAKIETQTVAFSIVALDRSISWLSLIVIGAVVLLGREAWRSWKRRVPVPHETLPGQG